MTKHGKAVRGGSKTASQTNGQAKKENEADKIRSEADKRITELIAARAAEGKKTRRRRVKMSDAMRRHGVDEELLSQIYLALLERLNREQNDKMLLDCAKECGKLLEAYPAPRAASEPDAVKILVDAPRPSRKKQDSASVSSSAAENAVPEDPEQDDSTPEGN